MAHWGGSSSDGLMTWRWGHLSGRSPTWSVLGPFPPMGCAGQSTGEEVREERGFSCSNLQHVGTRLAAERP